MLECAAINFVRVQIQQKSIKLSARMLCLSLLRLFKAGKGCDRAAQMASSHLTSRSSFAPVSGLQTGHYSRYQEPGYKQLRSE